MKIEQLMSEDVKVCHPEDGLLVPGSLMWNADCGIVPVVDRNGRVVGVITDRDICIAVCLVDARPSDLLVGKIMSRDVHACRPNDSIVAVEKLMQVYQVRRLPVINDEGRLVGLISLNDIVREANRERAAGARQDVQPESVTETLGAICALRNAQSALAA